MKTNVLLSLALVAALALGFWAGRHMTQRLESDGGRPGNLPPIQTSSTTATSGAAYLAEGTAEKLTVEQIAERLERECKHGVWRRTKEWNAIFNSLTSAELAQLARLGVTSFARVLRFLA